MANRKQVKLYEFGTKEFFLQYLKNQITKEGKTQETICRVHFAMSSLIFETNKGVDAFHKLKALTDACEELSKAKFNV